MKKILLEELEKKIKNKMFFFDEKNKLWRNVLDPSDVMSDAQYEAILLSIQMLRDTLAPTQPSPRGGTTTIYSL